MTSSPFVHCIEQIVDRIISIARNESNEISHLIRYELYVRNSLIETVLNRDILLLTPVVKPALFRQVFQMSVAHPAQIFSLNKMLGQLHEAGNASTISSYLRLLKAAMLMEPLEKYSGNRLRQKTSSPKLLTLNNALVNAARENTLDQSKSDLRWWGRLVENAVGASLINNNMGRALGVYYWRDHDDEVDYVLEEGDKVLGIEVKSVYPKVRGRGFAAFQRRHPQARAITVAPGAGDIPLENFLCMNAPEIFRTVW